MKRPRVIAVVGTFLAALLVGLGSAPRADAEADLTRRLLEALTASVQAHGADGCTVTDLGLSFQQVTMLAPHPTTTPYFSSPGVFLQKSDWCANRVLLQADGALTVDVFEMSNDLSAAHAVAHGTLTNLVDGSPVPVTLDVSFAPGATLIQSASNTKCNGDTAASCEQISSHRDGTLSGLASDGSGLNYLGDANATQTWNGAQIDSWVFLNFPCFPCP